MKYNAKITKPLFIVARYNVTTVNITENISTIGVSIYPNPTNGKFTIEANNIETVEITNIEGQLIKQIEVKNDKSSIDLNLEVKGVYFAKIITKRGNIIKIIIIK